MLKELSDIVLEAGEILLRHYKKKDLKIYTKPDNSPVTEADYAVSDYFVDSLKGKFPYSVITEEKVSTVRPDEDYFIIDPLDGTRYFIEGQSHYAILLAFVSQQRSVLGVTYFPSLNLMYTAQKDHGAFLNGQSIAHIENRQKRIAFSVGFHKRPEAQEILQKLNIETVVEQESVLKMTRLAEGVADFYPRFGRTYEWDTASTQILLEEAGCSVYDVQTLSPLLYSKPDFKNNGFVVFKNDLKDSVLEVLQQFQLKRGKVNV